MYSLCVCLNLVTGYNLLVLQLQHQKHTTWFANQPTSPFLVDCCSVAIPMPLNAAINRFATPWIDLPVGGWLLCLMYVGRHVPREANQLNEHNLGSSCVFIVALALIIAYCIFCITLACWYNQLSVLPLWPLSIEFGRGVHRWVSYHVVIKC